MCSRFLLSIAMPVAWEDILSRLCPEMAQRFVQMGMESVEDFRFFFTSFEDIQRKFPKDFEYTDEDHEAVFHLWKLVRALPESRVSLEQVENLTRSMRRRSSSSVVEEPVRDPIIPILAPSDKKRGLPLDASGAGRAKVIRLRAKPAPLAAIREDIVRNIVEFYVQLGPRGARWIGQSSTDVTFGFVARVVESFDDPTLKRHLKHLDNFRDFVQGFASAQDFLEPDLGTVIAFLQHGDARGNTVARGYFYNLMWWQTHLGMPFHTDHSAAEVFATHKAGHVVKQAEVIAIPVVVKILELASGFATANSSGAIAQILRMTLVFLASSVRHAHLRRSSFRGADDRFLHFHCSKGKRREKGTRPGFDWSVARYLVEGCDILGGLIPLYEELGRANAGRPSCPMPDVLVSKDQPVTNSASFRAKPMSVNKFIRILLGILELARCSDCHSRGITSYAFRRFCITIANVCRFHPEDQTAIGNWVESISVVNDTSTRRTCFATRTHYAGAKAQAAADVRLVTILAMSEACKSLGRSSITHAEVACVQDQIGDIWASAVGPSSSTSWIKPTKVSELPSRIAPHHADATEMIGSDGSDSSEASEDQQVVSAAQQPPAPEVETFRWFRQRSVIHVATEDGDFVALCSKKSFAREPAASGDSLASARQASGYWCRLCLSKVSVDVTSALLVDVS